MYWRDRPWIRCVIGTPRPVPGKFRERILNIPGEEVKANRAGGSQYLLLP